MAGRVWCRPAAKAGWATTITALAALTDAFGPIRDEALPEELRQLARQYWETFLETARAERTVDVEEYGFAPARAVQRAREMVPLSAQVPRVTGSVASTG